MARRRSLILAAGVCLMLGFGNVAWATMQNFKTFKQAYAERGVKASCRVCHQHKVGKKGDLNAYGLALQASKLPADAKTLTAEEFQAIDSDDADEDGASNLAELEAGTSPGDAESVPSGGAARGEEAAEPAETAASSPSSKLPRSLGSMLAQVVTPSVWAEEGWSEDAHGDLQDAQRIDNADCVGCHSGKTAASMPSFHADCQSCHGGGSLHVDDPGVETIAIPGEQACMDCHGTGFKHHLQWDTSQHRSAGVGCVDCHNPHATSASFIREVRKDARIPNADPASQLCLSCHSEIASRLNLPSHHPIREGGVECLDCHNPHEDQRLSLMSKNETCFACHQALQGPWTFEHPPAIDDCTVCHDPHGAPNPRLQKIAQPTQCLSCHTLANSRHAAQDSFAGSVTAAVLRKCTNCHATIHGSHQDPHLRR